MFPDPLSCDDFIGVNSAKSSPPYEQTVQHRYGFIVYARLSPGEEKGRRGENVTLSFSYATGAKCKALVESQILPRDEL